MGSRATDGETGWRDAPDTTIVCSIDGGYLEDGRYGITGFGEGGVDGTGIVNLMHGYLGNEHGDTIGRGWTGSYLGADTIVIVAFAVEISIPAKLGWIGPV